MMQRTEADALTLAREVGYVPEQWSDDSVLFTSVSAPTVRAEIRDWVVVWAGVDIPGVPVTEDPDWILAYSHKIAVAAHLAKGLTGRRLDKEDLPDFD